VKVTPIPAAAYCGVVANLNSSFVTLIAYTDDGKTSVVPIPTPPEISVAVEPIPTLVNPTPIMLLSGL